MKTKLLDQLTNFGQPIIEVVDANHDNRGELLLVHRHTAADLDTEWAQTTLGNLAQLWRRPVLLETKLDGHRIRLRHDGDDFSKAAVPAGEERS